MGFSAFVLPPRRLGCLVGWGSGQLCLMSMLSLTSQHYDLHFFPAIQTWSSRYVEVEEKPTLSISAQKNVGSVEGLDDNLSIDISSTAPGANNGRQTLSLMRTVYRAIENLKDWRESFLLRRCRLWDTLARTRLERGFRWRGWWRIWCGRRTGVKNFRN